MEPLMYCLEAGFPHPIIASMLSLSRYDITLDEAWETWSESDYWPTIGALRATSFAPDAPDYGDHLATMRLRELMREEFSKAVEGIMGDSAAVCYDCDTWTFNDDTYIVCSDYKVCESCFTGSYSTCARCVEAWPDHEMSSVADSDGYYCDNCIGTCYWCDDCEAYYRYNECEHNTDCECEALHKRFRFPANGKGTIGSDERLDVTLPAGTIDEVGIRAIREEIVAQLGLSRWDIIAVMEAIGDQWQGKKGNYTRRLSRELYSQHKVKIPDGVLSKIGNLARAHSDDTTEWAIEFTRDLNLPPEDFCHGDSCWWQSYSDSRCALKNWGGLGIRMFDENDYPVGRAWVQPLDADLQPSHETLHAHAYVVYNCYGSLDGAKAARIIAHLSSRTYRKVELESDPQYINNNSGWLVADEATAVETSSLYFDHDKHDTYDAMTINNDREVAVA